MRVCRSSLGAIAFICTIFTSASPLTKESFPDKNQHNQIATNTSTNQRQTKTESRSTILVGQSTTPSIVLYNQLNLDAAVLTLKEEAYAGIVDSQYYLGEALRKRNRSMTPDALHWYEVAAESGSVYAMIRLGRSGQDLCQHSKTCPQGKKNISRLAHNCQKSNATARRSERRNAFWIQNTRRPFRLPFRWFMSPRPILRHHLCPRWKSDLRRRNTIKLQD